MKEEMLSRLIQEYTFTSREENIYSEFPKKIKAFKKLPWPTYRFLPTQRYICTDARQDHRLRPSIDIRYNWTLSEEQSKILGIIKARSETYNYNCWLVNMKTWRWKSHIIMAVTAYFKVPTLVLCHNKKTLLEMVSKFKEFTNVTPWVYYWDKKDIQPITITTHDSFVLNEWVLWENDWWLILYDECDYNTSKEMLQSLCMTNAVYMYWLTWTPYRKDLNNEDLQKIFGKEITVHETVEQSYNIIPKICQIKYQSPNRSSYQFANWAEQKWCLVNDNDRLDKQISFISHISKTRNTILVLTERVEESENYWNRLYWLPWVIVLLINGKTKLKDDNEMIDNYVGKVPTIIIWTVWKMARWVDIPAIDTICLFSALHFRWTTVQSVWRALREYPWKDKVFIYDWCDYPMLSKQAFERRKAYMTEYNLTLNQIKIYDTKDQDSWEL